MKHNNQIVVGDRDRGRRDVVGEVQQVGGVRGKRDTIVWAEIRTTKKQKYNTDLGDNRALFRRYKLVNRCRVRVER